MCVTLQTLCRLCRISHPLWRQNDQQPIRAFIVSGNLQRASVALGLSVPKNVNRVAVAPVRWQKAIQQIRSTSRKRRQFPAAADERVCRKDARATGVSDDGEARTCWPRLLTQSFGHIKEVCNSIDTQYATTPECGVEHIIAAGERASMRGRCFRCSLRSARLDHDDRLA